MQQRNIVSLASRSEDPPEERSEAADYAGLSTVDLILEAVEVARNNQLYYEDLAKRAADQIRTAVERVKSLEERAQRLESRAEEAEKYLARIREVVLDKLFNERMYQATTERTAVNRDASAFRPAA